MTGRHHRQAKRQGLDNTQWLPLPRIVSRQNKKVALAKELLFRPTVDLAMIPHVLSKYTLYPIEPILKIIKFGVASLRLNHGASNINFDVYALFSKLLYSISQVKRALGWHQPLSGGKPDHSTSSWWQNDRGKKGD